ncbi:MAG: metallophosphoesterase [Clostridiales bacterium]|nr:metallophosphoesterase [Clostridiales bacterium]
MDKSKYKYIDTKEYDRVFVTSDIQGEYTHLKRALEKAGFTKQDVLIICGDIVDKGRSNIDTLNYIRRLTEEYNVYVLMGNRDYMYSLMKSESERELNFFLSYAKKNPNSLYSEMCLKAGVELKYDAKTVKILVSQYKNEIDFLSSLPVILETDDFYFVHAGLKNENIYEQDINACLTMRDFISVEHTFSKYCVVGHVPVCNLHNDMSDVLPYIDTQRRKLFIDGGLTTVNGGKLNLLYLPDRNAENYELISV